MRLLILFLTCSVMNYAQNLNLVTTLDNSVDETSGLIFFDSRLITHNDSGGDAALYEINTNSGAVSRTVTIKDASNTDWEDICEDENYIYIGDFGNNNGNRTNLRIYKILKTDYLNNAEVTPELIRFSYADQTDFTAAPQNTNYDAEALISFGENLFIFTKNWKDGQTNIYKIPKAPGTYSADRVDSFDAQGLVTAGSYNKLSEKVVLTGYAGITPFIIELAGFSNGKFSNGVIDRYNVSTPTSYSFQIEAVTYFNENEYYISAEQNALGKTSLYSISAKTLSVGIHQLNPEHLFPNPVKDLLTIDSDADIEKTEIYDYLGKKVFEDRSNKKTLAVKNLAKGIYVLKLYSQSGSVSMKFIKE